MSKSDRPQFLKRPDGSKIAYRREPGKGPGVLFCGGFRSDMQGTKALALEAHCRARGLAYVRFDYFGHGESAGAFPLGTIGGWREDTLAVLDSVCEGPQIVVGSSMGGWIMLLAALARPERVAGLIGIAPAPDFTERLMWQRYPESVRRTLLRDGLYREPSQYSEDPYPITLKLIEEGRRHLLLDSRIEIACPVRILQGMDDPDVPWSHSLSLVEALRGCDVALTLVKDGDHRLSRPQDLKRLTDALDELIAAVG